MPPTSPQQGPKSLQMEISMQDQVGGRKEMVPLAVRHFVNLVSRKVS